MKKIVDNLIHNIRTQFIGVLTFGFGVTAFYSLFFNYIKFSTISFGRYDLLFLILCSISFYKISKNENKFFDTLNNVYTLLGFVSMFIPIIIFITDKTFYINSIYTLILSLIIFLSKSITIYIHEHFTKRVNQEDNRSI